MSWHPGKFFRPRISIGSLLFTCLGTFFAAVGASAFNQVLESRRDARMRRTSNRPLVTRALSRTYAITFALIISIIGVAIICPTSNGLAACLATANILIYVTLYTPLKPRTTLNTLVGAVVGGIPPMIGWAAATDSLPAGAWILGAILFAWQIPHFLALAWMYREDYARGGFRMLPAIDPAGNLTSLLALIYAALLLPLSLALVQLGYATLPFSFVSLILTSALVALALHFLHHRTHSAARRLFLASIIYLPLFSIALMSFAHGPGDDLIPNPKGFTSPPAERFIDPSTAPPEIFAPPRPKP